MKQIIIEEDGWVSIGDEGLGDLDVDVEIVDKREQSFQKRLADMYKQGKAEGEYEAREEIIEILETAGQKTISEYLTKLFNKK